MEPPATEPPALTEPHAADLQTPDGHGTHAHSPVTEGRKSGESERLLRLAIGCGQACGAPILPHRAAVNSSPIMRCDVALPLA